MRKYIFICDKCKNEHIVDANCFPDTWKSIRIQVSFDKYVYYETLLCPLCIEELGIVEPLETTISKENVRDKLYKIIQDIVRENV